MDFGVYQFATQSVNDGVRFDKDDVLITGYTEENTSKFQMVHGTLFNSEKNVVALVNGVISGRWSKRK